MSQNRKILNPNFDLNPETRKKIERSVLKIFPDKDFHNANMRQLAHDAGVSLETIYNIYGNKEEMLFSFIDYWLSQQIQRLIDHLKGIKSTKEKLRKLFWVQLDYYERNPDVGKIIFMTVPFINWMKQDSYRQNEFINEQLMCILQDGQEDGTLMKDIPLEFFVDMIFGQVTRMFTMWIYRGQKGSLADQSDIAFEMIWRAIANCEANK
jgi:TetR/AcrR family transcriptional regulator, fatty acid metabolism regulator protein